MGSSSGGTQSTTTKTELPPWLDSYAQDTLKFAGEVADRPYQSYTGNRVAGMTGDQNAAAQTIRNMQGQAGQGISTAQTMTAGVAGYSPLTVGANYNPQQVSTGTLAGADLSDYQNPYTQQVINSGLDTLEQSRRAGLNQTADQAIAAGAFGGSRQGVAEGVVNAQSSKDKAAFVAEQQAANYNQAVQNYTNDQARLLSAATANQTAGLNAASLNQQGQISNQQALANAANLQLAAANQYGNLALSGQQAAMNDASAQSQVGAQQQAVTQAGYDVAYNNWLEQQNYPLQQLQTRLSALGGTPYGGTSTQITPVAGQNRAMGALGGAATGASMGAMVGGPYGAAIGGVAGGIYGAVSSDRRDKTDIKRLGTDPESGLDLYAYRYKGDPKSYPKVVGPMAQDVEASMPGSTAEIGGHKIIKRPLQTRLGKGGAR